MSTIVITLDKDDLKKLIGGQTVKVRNLVHKTYDNLTGVDLRMGSQDSDIVEVLRCKNCR